MISRLKSLALALLLPSPLLAAPEKLIFDTDMGNDIDDAQALALIHALQDRGIIDLLAVTSSKDHPLSAAYIDAVNTFYGRPNIPIGTVKNGVTKQQGRYLGVAQKKDAQGSLLYPHDVTSGTQCPDAVALIRKTLASQPDASVTIAQVGFFTNLVRLLDSPADQFSPLTGEELIRKKVKQLGLMAGSFIPIGSHKRYHEYNVKMDIPSAQALAQRWPGKMIWSGFEIGMAIRYPAASIQNDYNYTAHHPIKDGYLAYCGIDGENATYDLTTILHIAYPHRDYFSLSAPGQVTVADDSFTAFNPEAGQKNHLHLKLSPSQATRVKEAFVQLCSAPPRHLRKE